MKNNKMLVIAITIITVLIILMGGATFAFAYLKTDFLKTDKQLFFKYVSKAGENVQSLQSEKVAQYIKKVEKTPYQNEGKLSVNVVMPSNYITEYNTDVLNNFNIEFSGKIDKKNKENEQNIKLNYSSDISFPIDVKIAENKYGIKSEAIVNQYIAVDGNDIQGLFEKFGMTESQYKEIIEALNKANTDNENVQEQAVEELQKWITIILESLQDDNFSRIDENTFELKLNEKELMSIIIKISESLQTNQMISQEQKQELATKTENMKKAQYGTEEKLRITVNKSGKIEVIVKNGGNISIEKNNTGINIKIVPDGNSNTIEIVLR